MNIGKTDNIDFSFNLKRIKTRPAIPLGVTCFNNILHVDFSSLNVRLQTNARLENYQAEIERIKQLLFLARMSLLIWIGNKSSIEIRRRFPYLVNQLLNVKYRRIFLPYVVCILDLVIRNIHNQHCLTLSYILTLDCLM